MYNFGMSQDMFETTRLNNDVLDTGIKFIKESSQFVLYSQMPEDILASCPRLSKRAGPPQVFADFPGCELCLPTKSISHHFPHSMSDSHGHTPQAPFF